MPRPICWECGKQLMYVSGVPVYAVIADPIGVEHKVHKECAKHVKRERDDEKREAYRQWTGRNA